MAYRKNLWLLILFLFVVPLEAQWLDPFQFMFTDSVSATEGGGNGGGSTIDINIANSTYTEGDSSLVAQTSPATRPRGIDWSLDGTSLYVVCDQTDSVYQFTASTPFEVTSLTYTLGNSFYVGTQSTGMLIIRVKSDGTRYWLNDNSSQRIWQYDMTSGDVKTSTYDTFFDHDAGTNISSFENTTYAFGIIGNGNYWYLAGSDRDSLYQLTMATPYDISTTQYSVSAIESNVAFGTSARAYTHRGISWNLDGTTFVAANSDDHLLYQADASTAWDITSLSPPGGTETTYDVDGDGADLAKTHNFIFKRDDDTKFYILQYGDVILYQFTTGTQ